MCDNFGKRQADDAVTSSCKRIKVVQSNCQPTTSSGEIFSTTIEVAPEGNDREQPVADFENSFVKTVPTPIQYCGEICLQPEELLLYSLVKISSPSNSMNFVKGCTPERYLPIAKAVHNVYGIRFDCVNMQNYFYRSINNLTKGLGKYNGYLRWSIYFNHIDRIIASHRTVLLNLLLSSGFHGPHNYCNLRKDLENECLSSLKENKCNRGLAYKISNGTENLASKFPKWKVSPNVEESTVTLYYMGNSQVYPEYELIISSDGSYSFFFMGKPKNVNLDFNLVPPAVHNKKQLYMFMKSLEKFQVCSGVSAEKYIDLLPNSNDTPVYKTVDGKPAAFVESSPSRFTYKLIRSAQCSMLIQDDVCCNACSNTNHYMRTLKSRSQDVVQDTFSKHTRYDYMSNDQLLQHSRSMAERMHSMQIKLKRLEQCQREMSTVGSQTDTDFRNLFKQLYQGLNKNIEKHDDHSCHWDGCPLEEEFTSPE